MGIRSLQMSNSSCAYIDYSFTTSSITATGFNLYVELSQTYNILYSTLILDYFAQNPAN